MLIDQNFFKKIAFKLFIFKWLLLLFHHDLVVVGVGRDLQVLHVLGAEHVQSVTVLDLVADQVLATDHFSNVEEEHDVDNDGQVAHDLL